MCVCVGGGGVEGGGMYLTLMTQTGGDALVSSGIMESLLQVLEWKAFEPMNITVSPKKHNNSDIINYSSNYMYTEPK